jgi:hypothetical protein
LEFFLRTINSGKSKLNEDQARAHYAHIRVEIPIENGNVEMNGHTQDKPNSLPIKEILIPYYYFAVFDGHAGAGAAGNDLISSFYDSLLSKLKHVFYLYSRCCSTTA